MFEDSTHGGRQNWWLRYPTFLRTSTHALTEGDSFIGNWRCALIISTHALTEGDAVLPGMYRRTAHFNSRPHGGRRTSYTVSYECLKFQLTPSRRATLLKSNFRSFSLISTHALTEGDKIHRCYMCLPRISTHALTEGDPFPRLLLCRKRNFNSRPHGGRRAFRMYMDAMKHFNSRPHGGRHFDVQLVQSI